MTTIAEPAARPKRPLAPGCHSAAYQPGKMRLIWLWVEMLVLFVAAPVGVTYAIFGLGYSLFEVMMPIFAVFILFLALDRSFSWRRLFLTIPQWQHVLGIILLFAVSAPAIIWFTQTYYPKLFLNFPRRAPDVWLFVMIFYPLVSVVTQELVYRIFFFHRYAVLFGGRLWLIVLANGALFALGHIMFGNVQAVVISLIGGLIFAYRYGATGSFWAVALEHTLYGNLIFTVGLGRFFFTGVSNV